MAKIEKMFGAILKDQEQKSDELRDKIHAEKRKKKPKNPANVKKQKSNSSIKKEAPDPLMQVRSFFIRFFSVKRERACPRLHQAQRA